MTVVRPYFFEEVDVVIINRDDGITVMELRDDSGVVGIIPFTPGEAIKVGSALVDKGTSLNAELQAIADGAPAWRDRNGHIWYGHKGDERMRPADADTDQADHSWEELSTYFGPLTPIGGKG